ncbi:kinase-like domain-containing protein [Earliella scabrosa]|nr:kinase-like domain-containing protein [Earliella scabrosa]
MPSSTPPPALRSQEIDDLLHDTTEPGSLYPSEIFWRDHQKWLEEQGYLLRRRYRPDWVPSWTGTKKSPRSFEDGHSSHNPQIMDAKRMSDGKVVVLKRVQKSLNPQELEITSMFSVEPLASDPRNHCVPIYAALQSPHDEDSVLLVMPLLRQYNKPRFYTYGEAIECFRQLFEGVQFMHQHRVAHRDIHYRNTMMDPLPIVSEVYHPILDAWNYDGTNRRVHYFLRTGNPTKYYFIDFGISRRYSEDCTSPREPIIMGGDRSVPEFKHSNDPCDPFPTDIYYLGNLLREDLLEKYRGFEFIQALVSEMVQDDPSKRPTIDEVIKRFESIRSSLSTWKLRSRIVGRKDSNFAGFFRTLKHVYLTAGFVVRKIPPLPTP